jgi:hypothetical protein
LRKKIKRQQVVRLLLICCTEAKTQEITTSQDLLAPRHLLHLRKKIKRNDNEPPNSPSSATPEKKNKEMMTSLLARRHVLHLRKKTKR